MLFAVCALCFDKLRVLLDGFFVCCSLLFVFRLFVCKTLVFDPGVSGTVVGFPVSLWSCVLLVLRLAGSVPFCFVALRRVVLVLNLCSRCSVELFSLLWVCVGGSAFLSRSA